MRFKLSDGIFWAAIALILIAVGVAGYSGCQAHRRGYAPVRGVVVDKHHRPAHTTLTSQGRGIVHRIHHPARYYVVLRPPWGIADGDFDKTLSVSCEQYEKVEVGDPWGELER